MKTLRKYHKWPSLIVGLFVLLFCFSGIVMNHRMFFASFNFPRAFMPADYAYRNWNLASVKGFLKINDLEMLAYGNTGIWKTNKHFSQFDDFNTGFPKGIDHRKVFTMIKTTNGSLYAGTLFGLYQYNQKHNSWEQITLPTQPARVVKLIEKNGKLIVLSRSEMWEMTLSDSPVFTSIEVPPTVNHENKVGLFRTLWVVHSGEIFGLVGKIVVDLVGLATIFLVLSGFYYTFLPKFAKKLSDKRRSRLRQINKKTINWHTLLGVYGIPIFMLTTLSGMFLRPPLLIPIANKEVSAIPGTILDHENVWHDKFRDVIYDTIGNRYLISTNEGFISLENRNEQSVTTKLKIQPPISVMGINAFEDLSKGEYLVASFSGIYKWNPGLNTITDMITGLAVTKYSQGNPFGAIAVAGVYMENHQPKAIMDYGAGWINLKPGIKPTMPELMAKQPISWWNLALEIHTGRIFSFMMGNLYILYVPLMGITMLVILVSGLLIWFKNRKRKNKSKQHGNNQIRYSTQS